MANRMVAVGMANGDVHPVRQAPSGRLDVSPSDIVSIHWERHDGSKPIIAIKDKADGDYVLSRNAFFDLFGCLRQANLNTGMIRLIGVIERYLPDLHFVPENEIRRIALSPDWHPIKQYMETFLLFYWQNVLDDVTTFLLSPRDKIEVGKLVADGQWRHIKSKWFGFADVNDAILIKMKYNGCKVFPVYD